VRSLPLLTLHLFNNKIVTCVHDIYIKKTQNAQTQLGGRQYYHGLT